MQRHVTADNQQLHAGPPSLSLHQDWEAGVAAPILQRKQLSGRWSLLLRILCLVQFSSVQSLSRVRLFATPWIAARQASLSITNSRSSLRLIAIKSVMPSSHLILCRPLLLLPPIPPSISVFSNESTLRMRWPRYWSFSFSIIPSKEILQNGLVGSPSSPRDTTNCGKFLKRWEYQTNLLVSCKICMQAKKQQLELDMEKQTGSK